MKAPSKFAPADAAFAPPRSGPNMEFTYSHVTGKHMFATASAQAFSCDSLTDFWADAASLYQPPQVLTFSVMARGEPTSLLRRSSLGYEGGSSPGRRQPDRHDGQGRLAMTREAAERSGLLTYGISGLSAKNKGRGSIRGPVRLGCRSSLFRAPGAGLIAHTVSRQRLSQRFRGMPELLLQRSYPT